MSSGLEVLILWAILAPPAALLIGYRLGKGSWR
jgi:hypothetical protein